MKPNSKDLLKEKSEAPPVDKPIVKKAMFSKTEDAETQGGLKMGGLGVKAKLGALAKKKIIPVKPPAEKE